MDSSLLLGELLRTTSSVLDDLLAEADATEQTDVMRLIGERFEKFRTADGTCVMPGEVLLGSHVETLVDAMALGVSSPELDALIAANWQ